uniref:Uncharacterized protein n=1 Tax=Anguilla anguilla TaxID=7936 RepID=A0A0E9VPB2_ANGAN
MKTRLVFDHRTQNQPKPQNIIKQGLQHIIICKQIIT